MLIDSQIVNPATRERVFVYRMARAAALTDDGGAS